MGTSINTFLAPNWIFSSALDGFLDSGRMHWKDHDEVLLNL